MRQRLGAAMASSLVAFAACSTTKLPPPLKAPSEAAATTTAAAEFPTQVAFDRPGMTCREATRAARTALRRMGYLVDSVVPPSAGVTGELRGVRHTGWNSGHAGDANGIAVRIRCDDRGSSFQGATEEGFSERMAFRRDLPGEIDRASSRRPRQPTAAATEPTTELRVFVTPLRGGAAAKALGGSPLVVGITPIRVQIVNGSDRLYRLEVRKQRLMTEEGTRVRPLPIEQVAARVAPEWQDSVRNAQLQDGDIAVGASVDGMIFVPEAAYRRAKFVLIEAESGEAEGFSVEF